MSKKVCKNCKRFVEERQCPICKTSSFTNLFQGRISIINPERSEIAKKMDISHTGDYAIKVK